MTGPVLTLAGTRPELVRLSQVIPVLDSLCDHRFVYTGQNFDPNLRDIFFDDLSIRPPDADLAMSGTTLGERLADLYCAFERLLTKWKPSRVLVLGDTDSALATLIAARSGVAVFHMEAGNRCFDPRVPEELNRRVVDQLSTVLMPYTERSAANLLREGFERDRIVVTGNPIAEVIAIREPHITASTIVQDLDLKPGNFALLTLHRAETVDDGPLLAELVEAIVAEARPRAWRVVFPVHPRTAARLAAFGIELPDDTFTRLTPIGFDSFIALERSAALVMTDSGTVQEECVIARVPHVVLRDTTERHEAIECGAGIIGGRSKEEVSRATRAAIGLATDWVLPVGYEPRSVANTVAKALLGRLPNRG